jgi:selenocysteine lyase/cysteine desulfurase
MLKTEKAVDWREEFVGMDERVFLDCANQGPFPRVTIQAVEQALELKKYPERLKPQDYLDLPQQTRTALAKLIGAEPGEIALTNGASDGINAVANGLEWKAGDEIVLPAREFPANYFPWKHQEAQGVRVREVEPVDGRFVTADDLIAALTEKTRLVAASYVGYTTSNRLDLARVGEACRARGIPLVVDASQAVGALDFTAEELRCDFLAVAGYKWLFGPYGTGFFYARQEWQERLRVRDVRWLAVEGAENFNQLPRQGWRLVPDARRWDATEVSNWLNLSAVKASAEFLLRVGVRTIEEHTRRLCDHLVERLPRDRCLLRSPAEAERRGPYVCVAARTAEKTRALWETLRQRKIFVSLRGDALRVAPNIYNRESDIDRLLAVLAE